MMCESCTTDPDSLCYQFSLAWRIDLSRVDAHVIFSVLKSTVNVSAFQKPCHHFSLSQLVSACHLFLACQIIIDI